MIISGSPHIHSTDSVSRDMLFVLLALLPTWVVAWYAFGWSTLFVTLLSVGACVGTEVGVHLWRTRKEGSLGSPKANPYSRSSLLAATLTGVLLAFNVPSSLPWWMVVLGGIVAIGIGKVAFGGLGQNIFNPALVGRVFLLISFPAAMTTWPAFQGVDGLTCATPLAVLKDVVKTGDLSLLGQLPDAMEMLLGTTAGSLGEISEVALLAGGIFLLCTRTITWHIPVSILVTVAIFAVVVALGYNLPVGQYVVSMLTSGGLVLGAFFMTTDYVTSPMKPLGKVLFGVGIGLILMVIRLWGAYPEGMSFAILLMNACVPLLDRIKE